MLAAQAEGFLHRFEKLVDSVCVPAAVAVVALGGGAFSLNAAKRAGAHKFANTDTPRWPSFIRAARNVNVRATAS